MKTELQDVKDRIFQLQCDSKLKLKEGSETIERLNKENVSLSHESRSQKTTIKAMDAQLKESLKLENESKMFSHTMKETQTKSVNLNQNLRETQVKLAVEENISEKLREKLFQSLNSQEIKTKSIRPKTLEIDYTAKRSFLDGRAGADSAPLRPFSRPPGLAAPPPHQSRGGRDGVLTPPVSRSSPTAAPYPDTRSPR